MGGGFKKLELQIQDFSGIAVDPKALFLKKISQFECSLPKDK